jgi:hypothetical protein
VAGRGRRLTRRVAGSLAERLLRGYKSVMTAESGRGPAPNDEAGQDQSEGVKPGEMPGPASGPRRIVVAGDWHGNEDWAVSVIRRVPRLLAGESQRLILHLGDFGIWPDRDGKVYLDRVSGALAEAEAELWFVDGNHEDFSQLGKLDENPGPDGRVPVVPRVMHLPRGYRWNWHGRSWLACGGAVSLDRAVRTEGVDWWPQEEITTEQEVAISASGHADVMACHDCPSGVAHTFAHPPPEWAAEDLARNDAHRRRLQRIVDAVMPAYLMHGHLHRAYRRTVDFGYGPVRVTGLDADNRLRNFAALDVTTMQWDVRAGWFSRFRRGPGAG